MKTIDLHTHSTASDGTYTPTELVRYAAQKGLTAIALTDHDTMNGLAQAQAAGVEYGVQVINGAEFSTQYDNISLHIVGLFLPTNSTEIKNRLEYMQENRRTRNDKMVANLAKMGIDINMADIKQKFPDSVISRAHIAQYMVDKGYASNKDEVFAKYIGSHCSAYVEKESLTPLETIDMIKNAGGISVWAHPLLCKLSAKNLEKMTGILTDFGLDAIEAYYCTYSPADCKYVKQIAQKYGLALSGGSDFHGTIKPKLELGTGYGNLSVPYEILPILENLKKERKNEQ